MIRSFSWVFWISAHKANDALNGSKVVLYSNSNPPLPRLKRFITLTYLVNFMRQEQTVWCQWNESVFFLFVFGEDIANLHPSCWLNIDPFAFWLHYCSGKWFAIIVLRLPISIISQEINQFLLREGCVSALFESSCTQKKKSCICKYVKDTVQWSRGKCARQR